VSAVRPMMGGSVGVHLSGVDRVSADRAHRDAERLLDRMAVWAARLTRFDPSSELARLNDSPRSRVSVRPTLASALEWGRVAGSLTDGVVDIALLDARLSAEGIDRESGPADGGSGSRTWSVERHGRRYDVLRPNGVRFDLDGVAKGWFADRALERLAGYPAAVVDADGDIAIGLANGRTWRFRVADPRTLDQSLVEIDVRAPAVGRRRYGLATSGTSVHRWINQGRVDHHLIDPQSRRPACTDVIQATVLAGSAREAEAVAKTAVILGSEAALAQLDRPGIDCAILLTKREEVLATPSTLHWLA
jgi:FAD:protein FMN transferase